MRRQDSNSLCLLNEIVRSRVESVLSTKHLDSKIKKKNSFGTLRLLETWKKKLDFNTAL